MLTKRILSLQTISRNIAPYSGATRHQLHTSIKLLSASSSESSDSSGSDSDKESITSKLKKELAEDLKGRNRKDALSSLISDFSKKTASSKIDVAIPKKAPRPPIEKEPEVTEESQFEAKLTSAAKTVAEKIGGDVKKTEIDLLDRLLKKKIKSDVDEKPDTEASSDRSLNLSDILKECKVDKNSEINREVDIQKERINRIRNTTRKVDSFRVRASYDGSILHDLLRQKKEADLLEEKHQSTESNEFSEIKPQASRSTLYKLKAQKMRANLSEQKYQSSQIEGFSEIERQASRTTFRELEMQKMPSKASQKEFKVPQDESSGISEQPKQAESTLWNLYNEKKRSNFDKGKFDKVKNFRFHSRIYGIFKAEQTAEPNVAELSTWTELEKKELKSLLYHPPQNYFQEMIQWTEQGKVWRFPIDNEQGMEEEQNIHFSEHIFMERHLKGWCPKKGPIRHFMELVCVGLSKNPYMTVQEKVEHIMWYKDYFGDKRELLTELGAIEIEDSAILPKPTNKIDLGPHV